MPSNEIWNALGAIISGLTLILTILLERKKIFELINSTRTQSINISQGISQVVITIIGRAWRFLVVIFSLWWLGIWIQANINIRLMYPFAQWSFLQWLFLVSLIIPLSILLYELFYSITIQTANQKKISTFFSALDAKSTISVVYYDKNMPCSWVHSPEKASSYFEARGFKRVSGEAIAEIMEKSIRENSAYRSILVFINDIVPATIIQVTDPSCTLRRFLNTGGRVVWWGDIPLHQRGFPKQMREQKQIGREILGVDYYTPFHKDEKTGTITGPVLWSRSDLDKNIKITDAGLAIGMTLVGNCIRPAAVRHETVVYSEICGDLGFGDNFKDYRWAISFREVYNRRFPHSGFMQFPLMNIDCNNEAIVRQYYNFAISDWPLSYQN